MLQVMMPPPAKATSAARDSADDPGWLTADGARATVARKRGAEGSGDLKGGRAMAGYRQAGRSGREGSAIGAGRHRAPLALAVAVLLLGGACAPAPAPAGPAPAAAAGAAAAGVGPQ